MTIPEPILEDLWSPLYLERFARTYWRYLSRITLGLIRVIYSTDSRRLVFIANPLVLIRFDAPEYEFHENEGIVRWRIRSGFLVDSVNIVEDNQQGYLQIKVIRLAKIIRLSQAEETAGEEQSKTELDRFAIRIEVEVSNFYPSISSKFTQKLYMATQSRIHVLVTHGFLRSLSKLRLSF